jgi:Protein of unknown function (DUF3551)
MRKLAFVTTLMATTTFIMILAAGEAQAAKWCSRSQLTGTNCGFATFSQCRASASGTGADCIRNPRTYTRSYRQRYAY